VHQRGRFERLAIRFLPETSGGHAAEIGVDQRNQFVQSRPVAVPPGSQELCDGQVVVHNGLKCIMQVILPVPAASG
jgi:hypothetical protein